MALAAWRVDSDGPQRLEAGSVELERHLEDWIAADIGLLDPSLLVIQRQMRVDGGILDLLCVDPQGIATVVEIKRGKLIRETIAQAIDYASCIAGLLLVELEEAASAYQSDALPNHPGLSSLLDGSAESGQREVAIVVVGVGQEPGLERMIDFLGSRSEVQIRAVTFEVFDTGDARILVREDIDAPSEVPSGPGSAFSADRVIAAAGGEDSPRGRRLLKLVAAGVRSGLHARAFRWSFMLTPPERRTRCLFVFGRFDGGEDLYLEYYADAISEFFPIDADDVREIVGPDAVRIPLVDDDTADHWCAAIDQLFLRIAAGASPTTE